MSETPQQCSRTMRAVWSYNTFPELVVRKLLRELGLTGYRLHRKELSGRPGVAAKHIYPRLSLARAYLPSRKPGPCNQCRILVPQDQMQSSA